MAPKIIVFSSSDKKGKGKATTSSSSSSSSGTKRKSPPTAASSSSTKPKTTIPPVPTYPWGPMPPQVPQQAHPQAPARTSSPSSSKVPGYKGKGKGEPSHHFLPSAATPPPYQPHLNPYSPRFGGPPVSPNTAMRTAAGVLPPPPENHPNSEPRHKYDNMRIYDCIYVYKPWVHQLVVYRGSACPNCQMRDHWTPGLHDKKGKGKK